MQISGQSSEQTKHFLKELIGTDFQKLWQLNAKVYMNSITINREGFLPLIHSYEGIYPIDYFLKEKVDIKDVKLIELQQINIELLDNEMAWAGGIRVQTKEYILKNFNKRNNQKEAYQKKRNHHWTDNKWEINEQGVYFNLPPTTTYYQILVQKINGEFIREISQGKRLAENTLISIDKATIGENEVVVAFYEAYNEVYISFYKM